jgi:adenosylcobinamide-phosphate synthase
MAGKVERLQVTLQLLQSRFGLMAACLALDALLGDPHYAWHPIRLMGKLLSGWEALLRRGGLDGRFGGFLLFLLLTVSWGGAAWAVDLGLARLHPWAAWAWRLYLGYSLLALGDLVAHGRRIARATAKGDLAASRRAAGMLVGRDTDRMDFAACNRAAVESLAESLVDGVISPLFWFAAFGLPGLAVFKIASTMDSMVGYKNARYLRFGWFGARLDDVMNWAPARLGFLLIALYGALVPGCSGRGALRVGWGQHALLPGPNKGWSETATAGALRIRIAGPIWKDGTLVNDKWIGDPTDREGGTPADVGGAAALVYGVTLMFLLLAWAALRLAGRA